MNEEKLIKLKPVFILKKFFLVWLVVNFMIWIPIMLIFAFMAIVDPSIRANIPMIFPYILLIAIVFAIINLIIAFVNEKFNYKFTEYTIYNDRIEFQEGFINTNFTTLSIANIKEFHLEKTFFQRMFNLGTIRFVTAANAVSSYSTGIIFRDINNPDKIYNEIKNILEEKEKNHEC